MNMLRVGKLDYRLIPRPRRALLLTPTVDLIAIEKASKAKADGVIFDLEDEDDAKRLQGCFILSKALKLVKYMKTERIVRVNNLMGLRGQEDLKHFIFPLLKAQQLDAIILPPGESQGQLDTLTKLLFEESIETVLLRVLASAGSKDDVAEISDYLTSRKKSLLDSLVCTPTRYMKPKETLNFRKLVSQTAMEHAIQAIDMIDSREQDTISDSRQLGFTGKLIADINDVTTVQNAFRPRVQEVIAARRFAGDPNYSDPAQPGLTASWARGILFLFSAMDTPTQKIPAEPLVTHNAAIEILFQTWMEKGLDATLYLFDDLQAKGSLVPDFITFKVLLLLCVKSEQPSKGAALCKKIQRHDIEPDKRAFYSLLDCCIAMNDNESGKELLQFVKENETFGQRCDAPFYTQFLVLFKANEQYRRDALQAVDLVKKYQVPMDEDLYWKFIVACKDSRILPSVRGIIHTIKVPFTLRTYALLIQEYGKVKDENGGEEVLTHIIDWHPPNTPMPPHFLSLFAYLRRESPLMERITQFCKPFEGDPAVQAVLIKINGKLQRTEEITRLFDMMLNSDALDSKWSDFIAAYGEAGDLVKAFEVFEKMDARGIQAPTQTYTEFLIALIKNGRFGQAAKYVNKMKTHRHWAPTWELVIAATRSAAVSVTSRESYKDLDRLFHMPTDIPEHSERDLSHMRKAWRLQLKQLEKEEATPTLNQTAQMDPTPVYQTQL